MFEPIGGTAPKYTGQNVINPMAAIGAVQMLLAEIGEVTAAERVEQAIIKALGSGNIKLLSAGRMGMSTSEMGGLGRIARIGAEENCGSGPLLLLHGAGCPADTRIQVPTW